LFLKLKNYVKNPQPKKTNSKTHKLEKNKKISLLKRSKTNLQVTMNLQQIQQKLSVTRVVFNCFFGFHAAHFLQIQMNLIQVEDQRKLQKGEK
jgi:hypothetical protein